MTDNKRREYGDWQTPYDFAVRCCELVRDHYGFNPDSIVEPTCGIGNFIAAARTVFPKSSILGIEINESYVDALRRRFDGDDAVALRRADYLSYGASGKHESSGITLVLGNPPWATASTISSLGGSNLPKKVNRRNLKGISAMTGEGDFDICEWVIVQAASSLGRGDMLAMLCKTSVARNVACDLVRDGRKAHVSIMTFDAKKIFGVSTSACLLVCDFRVDDLRVEQAEMDDSSSAAELFFNGREFVARVNDALGGLAGSCQLTWRQGIKHDCGKIMELSAADGGYVNKLGERVDVEDAFLYPLVKSSGSRNYIIKSSKYVVPMTQKKIGDDTSPLKANAPKLWEYLNGHEPLFAARKSSIYTRAPRFAMFGVGDYSYAPYKVAVSGFYKDPIFSLAHGDKAIMFDDTCYFLAFSSEQAARVCMLLLNSEMVLNFYRSVAFLDSKRPFSKKVLSRIDLAKALRLVGIDGLNETAERIGAPFAIDDGDVSEFAAMVDSEPTLF